MDKRVMNVKVRLFCVAMLLMLGSTYSRPQTTLSRQQEIESHTSRAQNFIQEKRPDLAIPELEALIALDPKNLNGQANLGVLLYFEGDYAKARPHLQAAHEMQPELTKIQGLLGIAEKRTGETANARLNLEQSFPALQDGKFKTQAGMELIELYVASSEMELAAGVIGQLRREEPESLDVQNAAYRIYSELAGDSMLALSLVGPDSAQMHQVMAHEASTEGNTNVAIEQERAAIQRNPHLPGAHFELGELLSASGESGQQQEAEQEYLAALSDNRFDERAECRLGRVYARKGDPEKALSHFSAAVALQSNDAEAYSGMAQAFIELNQQSNALPLLEKAVKLEPTDSLDHYRLSRLYRHLGRMEEAKTEMELYQKYKAMKEKLRAIYKDLRLPQKGMEADEVKVDEK